MVTLILPGKPLALARPRFNSIKKRAYNAQKSQIEKARWIIKQQMAEKRILSAFKGGIYVDMRFGMALPSNAPKKAKNEFLGKPHTAKPDLDNLVKWVLDVLNGIVYRDDSLVAKICCEKYYSQSPKTEIKIQPL